MLSKIHELQKQLETRVHWDTTELTSKLQSLDHAITEQIRNDAPEIGNVVGTIEVDEVKKYDIVRVRTFGSIHFVIVYKVIDDDVYGAVITSKIGTHNVHIIEKDRRFKCGYASISHVSFPLEEAKKSFFRVYENKKEADVIFKKIKDNLKQVYNLK